MNRGTLNVLQLSVGFFFLFFALNTQYSIAQTVVEGYAELGLVSAYAGYLSISIIQATFSLGCLVAGPIVNAITAKWSMVSASLFYVLFVFGFLFLNEVFMYISAALLGFSAGALWAGNGKYLSLNSDRETAGRHSGLFFAMIQSSAIAGGIFMLVMFSTLNEKHIPDRMVKLIYGAFTVSAAVGVFVLALLRPAPGERAIAEGTKGSTTRISALETLKATTKLFATKPMVLMSVAFVYSGVELAFRSAIYPTCVSFTHQLGANTKTLLALSVIVQSLGQVCSGVLFGFMGAAARLGRTWVILIGTSLHMFVYLFVFVSFPSEASLRSTYDVGLFPPNVPMVLVSHYLLGFGDACWNTQIPACLMVNYSKQSAEAFSLFRFFQGTMSCLTFFYGTVVDLEIHLAVLAVTSLLGCACFFVAERELERGTGTVKIAPR
ncbi:Ion channel regulatory protein [Aphelenchoides avenae]|nr:Ion channel regulatory protein [Aphelenchus avenae]